MLSAVTSPARLLTLLTLALLISSPALANPEVPPKPVQPKPLSLPAPQPSKLPPAFQQSKKNIWTQVLGTVKLPVPWQARACDGNAPLLCIYKQAVLVGTIELGAYPIDSRSDFKNKLVEAGIPPGSVNYQNPQHRDKIAAALRSWIADYYSFFKQDRQTEYGKQIRITAQSPKSVKIGQLTGWSYGFTGQKQNGQMYEQRVGYVTFDGKILYVITTSFDPQSETGTFKTSADFQQFEPQLTPFVAQLQLPIKPVVR